MPAPYKKVAFESATIELAAYGSGIFYADEKDNRMKWEGPFKTEIAALAAAAVKYGVPK